VTSPAADPVDSGSREPSSTDDETRALNEKVMHEVFALISAGRYDDVVDLMHDDLVFELPYGPEGMQGPDDKKAYAAKQAFVFGLFSDFNIAITEVHRTLDPNSLVCEYASHCTVKKTGGPYNNRYIGVVEFRDGKVWHWKEFHNAEVATRSLS